MYVRRFVRRRRSRGSTLAAPPRTTTLVFAIRSLGLARLDVRRAVHRKKVRGRRRGRRGTATRSRFRRRQLLVARRGEDRVRVESRRRRRTSGGDVDDAHAGVREDVSVREAVQREHEQHGGGGYSGITQQFRVARL